MKKLTKLTMLAVICCIAILSSAQERTSALRGTVIDTLNKVPLSHAVIAVLRKKDSVLVKFTRSDKEGAFEISNLPPGQHIILVSYPNYADYTDFIVLENGKTVALGKVPVITKARLLEEVIVKQRVSAIRMKGDTTEYKADSFKVSANADVQELLKKMPGITVNSKGEITAQGQKVKKVLVDGEEFFSEDPAVVTKNLRADYVDKVQVFDKKSEQAAFTGIDDGEKTKTINLQLKEEKKKGYFGKVEAGSDFDRYRNGKAMANFFKGKKKAAAYITSDNTKFESLNWSERSNYGEDMNRVTQVMDDGGVSMWSSGDNFSWGQGLPTSLTGGLHFSNKWNKEKNNSINTYQFNDLRVTGYNTTKTQTLLSDSTFLMDNATQDFNNHRQRNRFRTTYDWQIDSTSSLKIIATGSVINTNAVNNYNSTTVNNKGSLINNTIRTTTDKMEERNFISNIIWKKRFKKKGRTIIFNTDITATGKDGTGFLFANIATTAAPLKTDQNKTNNEKAIGANGKLSFTEPLWKNTFLEMNYRFAFNSDNAERNTLEGGIGGSGKYDKIIDSLSNHFKFTTNNNAAGFNIRYTNKKVSFSAGAALGKVIFYMQDFRKNLSRDLDFNNFLPSASITFTPKKQRRLGFTYNGSTTNPTFQQINPIINNIDPLNITIGNPNLKQEFRHNFGLNFSEYKVLKDKNVYASANFAFIDNAITNGNTIDPKTGIRTNQAINVNGNYNFSMWANYSFNVAPSFNVNFQLSPRVSRFNNFINGQKNTTDSKNLGFEISSGYWGDKPLNYWFGIGASRNSNRSSLSSINTDFWSYTHNADFNWKMKKIKMYVNINTSITIYQRTAVFTAPRDVYIINSSIKKSLDKAENWQVGILVNDLLNQNQQINRNINSNFISETTQQNIQRYFMLQLTYNFSKNGKPSEGW
jgi:hypothetical protein